MKLCSTLNAIDWSIGLKSQGKACITYPQMTGILGGGISMHKLSKMWPQLLMSSLFLHIVSESTSDSNTVWTCKIVHICIDAVIDPVSTTTEEIVQILYFGYEQWGVSQMNCFTACPLRPFIRFRRKWQARNLSVSTDSSMRTTWMM